MLTALAFLLCATLPLLCHLGHPERNYEILMTPHLTSPMACFGFVYAWYLMAVLLLELWFDFRQDFVKWSKTTAGFQGIIYRLLTLGVTDVSEKSVRLDMKMEWILSIVGIPSAFLLHGYVGFIFGSIKANPWWGNVLMPIMFILSAIVSGIALCVFNYIVLTWIRRKAVDMRCLDAMAMFLFYALLVDAVVEGLDVLHRGFAAEEGFVVLQTMIREKLFYTLNIGQVGIGTLLPLLLLGSLQVLRQRVPEATRRIMIFCSGVMILFGVLMMRWNVVMGGQFFSKSFRGVMSYKMEFAGQEGWLIGAVILCLPPIILTVLVKLFLSESKQLQPCEHLPESSSTT
jgi:predicted membrane protein